MNMKKLNLLVFGLVAIQLFIPNFDASEVSQPKIEHANVKYAPVNPTPEEVATANPTDIVIFEDPVLESIIDANLRFNVGKITVEDMQDLVNISLYDVNVTSLSGLEYAVNLDSAEMVNTNISDFSPLANLSNLSALELHSNNISDLSPLSNLTNLTGLALTHNNISDLSPISNLSNLKYLYLNDNNISVLSPLVNLSNLLQLNLANNNISDLSPLANLSKLTSLDISDNNLSNLSPLANLIELSLLYLDNNNIANLSPLANLSKLVDLYLSNNNISDLSPLANLTTIKYLNLNENNISDLSPLANLDDVRSLNLSDNNISDLSPLANLSTINLLFLNKNNISDFSPLISFINSDYFSVSMNEQKIELPELSVISDDEITHDIIGLDGEIISLSLGRPNIGKFDLSANHTISLDAPIKVDYSATITQNVTYRTISGLSSANTNEESILTDDQLIALFNAKNVENKDITVDQSAIDYNTPGTYNVIFTDGLDQITCELTVLDLKPKITVPRKFVTINPGETIDDYITTFGVSATEITNGDLTSSITVDDSSVDFQSPGRYNVVFTVSDDENNKVEMPVSFIINNIPEVISEVPSEVISETNSEVISEVPSDIIPDTPSDVTPEINSEVISETNSEVISETNSEVSSETNSEVSTDVPSDVILETSSAVTSEVSNAENAIEASDVASSAITTKEASKVINTDKQQLTSTGNLGSVLALGLVSIVTMLFSIKKTIVSSKL